jgi:tetratricopeptide (TPR) repeat protein
MTPRGRAAAVALVAVLLGCPAGAAAGSALVAELEGVATRYHLDPARLDVIRAELERAARSDPDADTLVALARASFLWGDVRAVTVEEKLAAYAAGRDAARRAVALAPGNALAHLFLGINTGRWGQTKGILRSLFLLGEVREAIRRTLELDPTLPAAYALAGNVDFEVPALFGGSLERAEERFRAGLRLDPHFTVLGVGLAKVLARRGHADEARRELQAVLDERAPANPADWAVKDAPEARALLASLPAR